MLNFKLIILATILTAITCGASGAGGLPAQHRESAAIKQGDAYLLARKYDKAVAEYEADLKAHPGSTITLQKLADAEMASGRDEQATTAYRRLLSIDDTNSEYRYTLGILFERQGMLDEAEEQYLKTVQRDPNNGDARRHLADIYTLRGNFPLAIREYQELLTDHNDNPLLHFKLARAYERNKQHKEAIAEYRKAIMLAPDNVQAHKDLAVLYAKSGMGNEAVDQYRELLRLDSSDNASRNALIGIYVNMRSFGALYTLVKEGVELFPNDPDSHFRLGLIYDFRKEYDASIIEYRKALELKSDHAKALKGLGKVYFKTGRFKEARTFLEAAKKSDPGLLETSELLNNLSMAERRIHAKKAAQLKKKKAAYKKKQAAKRSKAKKNKKSKSVKKKRSKHKGKTKHKK